jgi:hypothetical protein
MEDSKEARPQLHDMNLGQLRMLRFSGDQVG